MIIMMDGIVMSKLRYNIVFVGNLWIEDVYTETEKRFRKYTKKIIQDYKAYKPKL